MSEKYILSTFDKQHNFLGTEGSALGSDISGVAVAIYSADDNSLIFYNCQKAPEAGKKFSGKTATNVYTGFETAEYSAQTDVPWDSIRNNIKTVSFDKSFSSVCPISTSFWFCYMNNCESIDLTNLNMSK